MIIKSEEHERSLQLLQYYRHDLINKFQLVQAYMSMNNYEQVKDKIDDIKDTFQKESLLISLQAPRFILWVLQFNHVHSNISLTYDVQVLNKCLSFLDEQLVAQCSHLVNSMKKTLSDMEVCVLHLHVGMEEEATIKLTFSLSGEHIQNYEELTEIDSDEHGNVSVYQNSKGITYEYVYSL